MTYAKKELKTQPPADAKTRLPRAESLTIDPKDYALAEAIIKRSTVETIRELLKAKANPNVEIPARLLHPESSENVRDPDADEVRDRERYTALYQAVKSHQADVVEALLEARANPWIRIGVNTILKIAKDENIHYPSTTSSKIVEILTKITDRDSKKYESPHSKDDALLTASHTGDTYKVIMLLEIKANPDRFNIIDKTYPLLSAASEGHAEALRVLVGKYDHLTFWNYAKEAMEKAASNGHMAATKALATHLNNRGFNYSVYTSAGNLARENGHLDIAEFLEQQSKNAQLFSAVTEGNIQNTQKLLETKADINALDDHNKNALYLAVDRDNIPLIKLLLQQRADPNIKSRDIHWGSLLAPLSLAAQRGNTEIVSLLLEAKTVIRADKKPSLIYKAAQHYAGEKHHNVIQEMLEKAFKHEENRERRTAVFAGRHRRTGAKSPISHLTAGLFDPQALRVALYLADCPVPPVKLSTAPNKSDEEPSVAPKPGS